MKTFFAVNAALWLVGSLIGALAGNVVSMRESLILAVLFYRLAGK